MIQTKYLTIIFIDYYQIFQFLFSNRTILPLHFQLNFIKNYGFFLIIAAAVAASKRPKDFSTSKREIPPYVEIANSPLQVQISRDNALASNPRE